MAEPCKGKPYARFFGGTLETGQPDGHLRVPGRCAEKRHHDGLVGTQPPVTCYRASVLPDRAIACEQVNAQVRRGVWVQPAYYLTGGGLVRRVRFRC